MAARLAEQDTICFLAWLGYNEYVFLEGDGARHVVTGLCYRPFALPMSESATSHPYNYQIEVGIYEPQTDLRLDRLDMAGNPAGNSLRLADVAVQGNE